MASKKRKKPRENRRPIRHPERTRLPSVGEVDGRSTEYIVYKRLCAALVSDAGGEVSTGELELARRISGLGVVCSQFEAKLLRGEPYTFEESQNYGANASTQGRLIAKFGTKRKAKAIPTFAELAGLAPPAVAELDPVQAAAAADRAEDDDAEDREDDARGDQADPVIIDQTPAAAPVEPTGGDDDLDPGDPPGDLDADQGGAQAGTSGNGSAHLDGAGHLAGHLDRGPVHHNDGGHPDAGCSCPTFDGEQAVSVLCPVHGSEAHPDCASAIPSEAAE